MDRLPSPKPLPSRRTFVRRAAMLAGMTAASSLLAACSPGQRFGEVVFDETPPAEDADEQTTAETTGVVPATSVEGTASSDGGRLYVGLAHAPATLDPVRCTTMDDASIARCVVEGLVRETDDGTGVEACLAQSWDVDETGRVYTFHLESGLVFSDGSPVTAEDWLWSFDRALGATEAPWHANVDVIEGVACPDDLTVEVTFAQADDADAAHLAVYALGVQSKAHYQDVDPGRYGSQEGGAETAPLGTGAWVFSGWDDEGGIKLAANERYREAGAPLLAAVSFTAIEDAGERLLQLQRGNLDVAASIPGDYQADLESDPNCTLQDDASTAGDWPLPGVSPEDADGQPAGDADEPDATPHDFLALRKAVTGLVRTPLGAWRLDNVEKSGE